MLLISVKYHNITENLCLDYISFTRLYTATRNISHTVIIHYKSIMPLFSSEGLGGQFTWMIDAADHCNQIQNLTQ